MTKRKAWFRVSVHAPRNAKLCRLSSDAVRWTWLIVLSEAKLQNPQGEWNGYQHFRACLCGRPRKHLAELIDADLINLAPDGRVVIHDWQEWQSDTDESHRRRQKEYLERQKQKLAQLRIELDATESPVPIQNVTSRVTSQ